MLQTVLGSILAIIDLKRHYWLTAGIRISVSREKYAIFISDFVLLGFKGATFYSNQMKVRRFLVRSRFNYQVSSPMSSYPTGAHTVWVNYTVLLTEPRTCQLNMKKKQLVGLQRVW